VTAILCWLGWHDWVHPERPLFLDIRFCARCASTEQWRETEDGKGANWVRLPDDDVP